MTLASLSQGTDLAGCPLGLLPFAFPFLPSGTWSLTCILEGGGGWGRKASELSAQVLHRYGVSPETAAWPCPAQASGIFAPSDVLFLTMLFHESLHASSDIDLPE